MNKRVGLRQWMVRWVGWRSGKVFGCLWADGVERGLVLGFGIELCFVWLFVDMYVFMYVFIYFFTPFA